MGFIGVGKYSSKNRDIYKKWSQMLHRCYYKNYHIKNPTYKDVTVCEHWHNFQNFAEWFEENYNPETMKGWQLDKDILVKDNKIYSPDACCFVPPIINSIFSSKGNFLTKGVTKWKNKFKAEIRYNGSYKYLGLFNTVEEAKDVYDNFKIEYVKNLFERYKDIINVDNLYNIWLKRNNYV